MLQNFNLPGLVSLTLSIVTASYHSSQISIFSQSFWISVNCVQQVQTRSADEPMTTFVLCNECGNRWKVSCQRNQLLFVSVA